MGNIKRSLLRLVLIFFFFTVADFWLGCDEHSEATKHDEIHDAMRISQFLNPIEEVVEDDDEDILADILLDQSLDEARSYQIDEESD